MYSLSTANLSTVLPNLFLTDGNRLRVSTAKLFLASWILLTLSLADWNRRHVSQRDSSLQDRIAFHSSRRVSSVCFRFFLPSGASSSNLCHAHWNRLGVSRRVSFLQEGIASISSQRVSSCCCIFVLHSASLFVSLAELNGRRSSRRIYSLFFVVFLHDEPLPLSSCCLRRR